ncbi:hypothetical protein EUGRSUZ_C01040 [Eucalyptus grandis]|uniref:Uncharacterized protein n=2 Tax=Eucalyptus grandis TaxID=71139 RepID=A0ACC3LBW0_EUCGR|nr:hypothetical protein EUGRSUZ_C01040 [Eucalyptus grandis]
MEPIISARSNTYIDLITCFHFIDRHNPVVTTIQHQPMRKLLSIHPTPATTPSIPPCLNLCHLRYNHSTRLRYIWRNHH